jgi:hypothetical protein
MSTPVKSALSPAQNGSSSRRLSGGYDTATPKNKYDTPVASGSQYRPGNRGVGDHAGGMLLDTPMGRSGTNSGRSSPVSGNESPGCVLFSNQSCSSARKDTMAHLQTRFGPAVPEPCSASHPDRIAQPAPPRLVRYPHSAHLQASHKTQYHCRSGRFRIPVHV